MILVEEDAACITNCSVSSRICDDVGSTTSSPRFSSAVEEFDVPHVHLWDYGANKSFSGTRKRSVPSQRPWTMPPRRKDSRAGRTDASCTAFASSERTSTNDGAGDATHRSADQAAHDDEARCEGGRSSN